MIYIWPILNVHYYLQLLIYSFYLVVFTAGPMNMTLNVGDSDIVLTCDVLASLRSVTIWEHLLNGEIIDIIASNFGNK